MSTNEQNLLEKLNYIIKILETLPSWKTKLRFDEVQNCNHEWNYYKVHGGDAGVFFNKKCIKCKKVIYLRSKEWEYEKYGIVHEDFDWWDLFRRK